MFCNRSFEEILVGREGRIPVTAPAKVSTRPVRMASRAADSATPAAARAPSTTWTASCSSVEIWSTVLLNTSVICPRALRTNIRISPTVLTIVTKMIPAARARTPMTAASATDTRLIAVRRAAANVSTASVTVSTTVPIGS
uniref:Uncharacterized protein n=1 Tax=Phlebotomus papatasi TaxID=29031 RepID=A0A1B0D123_PHLPP